MSMKEDDFADWYLDIVEKANLCDKRYPIKGMNVWTPYVHQAGVRLHQP